MSLTISGNGSFYIQYYHLTELDKASSVFNVLTTTVFSLYQSLCPNQPVVFSPLAMMCE